MPLNKNIHTQTFREPVSWSYTSMPWNADNYDRLEDEMGLFNLSLVMFHCITRFVLRNLFPTVGQVCDVTTLLNVALRNCVAASNNNGNRKGSPRSNTKCLTLRSKSSWINCFHCSPAQKLSLVKFDNGDSVMFHGVHAFSKSFLVWFLG